jgi:hypothetical protein
MLPFSVIYPPALAILARSPRRLARRALILQRYTLPSTSVGRSCTRRHATRQPAIQMV